MLRLVRLLTATLVALSALASLARAGERAVVVELFTSQGCNACPPADAILAKLAGREDVIALSLHVDYWDYLGWRDTFARPEFTRRQKAYRDAWGKTVVYTPQMVVQGRRAVPATDLAAIEAAIREEGAREAPLRVSIVRAGGMLECRIEPGPEPVTGIVWVAKYMRRATVRITRGENAGRTITYANIVTSLDRMGEWRGRVPEAVSMPQPGPGEGVAVWIQEAPMGRILAAAHIENAP